MDDHLANDRTFLAWLRTGISLFGLGFVVSKVAYIVDAGTGRVSDAGLYSCVGISIVVCGAAVVLVGYREHRAVATGIPERPESETSPATWPRTFAIVAVIGSVVLSALIALTT